LLTLNRGLGSGVSGKTSTNGIADSFRLVRLESRHLGIPMGDFIFESLDDLSRPSSDVSSVDLFAEQSLTREMNVEKLQRFRQCWRQLKPILIQKE
jgi:hypothetical protein